jgi:hypothetical protein
MRNCFSKKIILSIILIIVFPVFLHSDSGLKICNLKILNNQKKEITIRSEIAENDSSRSRGLMHRNFLQAESGMLFIFDTERYLSFWMKNTNIPLSIAYISAAGIVNEIHDMKPHDESPVPSRYRAKYALEANMGWFQKKSISPGSRLIIDGCISK